MSVLSQYRLQQQVLRATARRPAVVVAHLQLSLQPAQNGLHASTSGRRHASDWRAQAKRRPRAAGRQLVIRTVAMVNVDFASPSLILGAGLIACGVVLLNLRNLQNRISRDADIVVAAMVSIVGSTLIFQGWRLDPLLLLCQALTTSVALWYGLETFRLRSREADMAPPPQLPPGVGPDLSSLDPAQQAAAMQQFIMQQQQQQRMGQQEGYLPPAGAPYLPAGSEQYYPWGADANTPAAAEASTSGRPALGQMPYGGVGSPTYAETIQYDYYGNPIMPPDVAAAAAAFGAAPQGYGVPYGASGGPGYGEQSDPYARPGPGSAAAAYAGGPPFAADGGQAAGAMYGNPSPSPSYGGPVDMPYGARSPGPQRPPSPSLPLPMPLGPGIAQPPYGVPNPSGFAPGAFGAAGVSYGAGALYGDGQGGELPSAAAPTSMPYNPAPREAPSPAWGGGTAAGAGQGAAGGLGGGGVGGGGGVAQSGAGRVDLYEKVDDWE